MGLWDTIKGWLNIGGVQVLLWKYTEPLKRSDPTVTGAVLIKAKSPKTVLSLEVKLIEEFTSGKDAERTTEATELGGYSVPAFGPGLGYPLELKAGDSKEEPFTFMVDIPQRLKDVGGAVGAFGKVASFVKMDEAVYYLIATASVKGAAFSPSHKVKMKIVA